MNRTLRFILVTAVVFLAMGATYHYGGIWHSRAVPTPGAEVMFDDGRLLRGSLSREWDGSYVVVSGASRTAFSADSYRAITFAPSPINTDPDEIVPANWRIWFPTLVLLGWYHGFVLRFAMRNRQSNRSKAGQP